MSRFDSAGPVTRPVILVPAGFPAYGDHIAHAYARPLEAAGALPLHLPYLESYDDALDLADGILMGFGGDIDPARYGGDTAHPTLFGVSAARDAFVAGKAWVLGVQSELQESWKTDPQQLAPTDLLPGRSSVARAV